MDTPQRPRPAYNVHRMVEDMALKGWLPTDLARAAGLSDMTVHRFFKGGAQTERAAGRLANALGHPVKRYLLGVRRRGVAA